jgi:hypothetical protein
MKKKIIHLICAECDMPIGECGMCSYGCKQDSADLKGRTIRVAYYLLTKLSKPHLFKENEII